MALPTKAQLAAIHAAAIKKVAIEATSIIKRRTAAGKDINGAAFASYTPEYRKAKAGAGRNAGTPDLTLSGQLLGGLKFLRMDGDKAIIGWTGQHTGEAIVRMIRKRGDSTHKVVKHAKSVAFRDLVEGLQRKRPFFGIETAAELAQLAKVYKNERDRLLRALGTKTA